MAEGTYHDHMLLGAALMILLPMTLACCVSPTSQGRKTLALAALVVCVPALLLAQTRSSWIGAVVALLAFGVLWIWRRQPVLASRGIQEPRDGRGQALVYGILVAVALGGFLLYAQQNGLFADRVRTLTTSVLEGKEASLEWRFSTWRGAVKMIGEKPLLGWGVGRYPLHQQPFTGTGEPPAVVAANGPRIWDEAHNSYLQIAAELGVPGLLLWLSVLVASFAGGLSALKRLPDGSLHQRVLIGALSALAGQAVDALANPGWQFGEVAVYFWIALGLLIGLTGRTEEDQGRTVGAESASVWGRLLRDAGALVLCAWAIYVAITDARLLPTPHL